MITLGLLSILAIQHVYSMACQWVVNDTTLDLTKLKGLHVIANDSNGHDYYFSICENGVYCDEGEHVMVAEAVKSATGCLTIARWDSSIQPSYSYNYNVSNNTNSSWTFMYDNGDTCSNVTRGWKPTFVCNEHVHIEAGTVTQNGCMYELDIYTRWACLGNISTTSTPTTTSTLPNCVWSVSGSKLDLSTLDTTTLNYTSSNGSYYELSPCQNGIYCNGTGERGMATIGDPCSQRIASWNDSVVPTYSNDSGSWTFSYTNSPDECTKVRKETTPTTTITWNCVDYNSNVTNITYASADTSSCNFTINVDSNLACVSF